mmetsp:Transcript_24123/g.19873  ORF Transcript_24123/g.19873 Transcript_24123/m.19873 type:complete len:227 (+) Transcript_24123:349-1029(+)
MVPYYYYLHTLQRRQHTLYNHQYHHHNREQLHSETNSVCRGSGGGSSSLASRCSRHGLATSSTSAVSVAKRRLQRTFDLNKQCRDAYIQYRVTLPSINEENDNDEDNNQTCCLLHHNRHSSCSLYDGNDSVEDDDDDEGDDDIECAKYTTTAASSSSSTSFSSCVNNNIPIDSTIQKGPSSSSSFAPEGRRYKKPIILTFNVTLKGVQDFISTKKEMAGRVMIREP